MQAVGYDGSLETVKMVDTGYCFLAFLVKLTGNNFKPNDANDLVEKPYLLRITIILKCLLAKLLQVITFLQPIRTEANN